MARVVTELGRITSGSRSGRGTDGSVKQNKLVVWGKIAISSYSTGGEVIAPKDLGLAAIDFITTDVRFAGAAGTTEATGTAQFYANYITSSNKLIIADDIDTGTQSTNTHVLTVFYLAAGDTLVSDLT